jgi:serine kinase of HPr protein (carbohydrate metabolism regulator)
MTVLHATTLARQVEGCWRGVLVRGVSGSGKSDLALRALQAGWRLVSDDRTLVWVSGGELYGRAPETIAGLLEARGVGVIPLCVLPFTRIALVVDAANGPVERMPEATDASILDVNIPRLPLELRQASTLAKIGLALEGRAGRRGSPRL